MSAPTLKPKPTLSDIAERCQLSKGTVSRALHLSDKDSPVSESTRQRVRKVAQELGYRANWQAQALSRGRTHSVGLLYEGTVPMLDSVYRDMLETFVQKLRAFDYHLQLVPVDPAGIWSEALRGGRFDGCAMLQNAPRPILNEIADVEMPIVLLNAAASGGESTVCPDDEGGGRLAGEHLLKLGHRTIAYTYDTDAVPHFSIRTRQRGLEQAVQEAGGRVMFFKGHQYEVAPKLLDPANGITATVCYSHFEATPLLQHLWQLGAKVPDDMSLVAFNDEFPLGSLIPPVTTVGVPAAQIGLHGAEILLRQMRGTTNDARPRPPSKNIILEESLIIRASTAKPRST
ncbi:MAG: LacI family DNA-binding transcriptional regulator [Planctomycetota bacterium]